MNRTLSIILAVIVLSDFTTARGAAQHDLLTGVEQTESSQSDRNDHSESDALIKNVKTAQTHFQSGQFDLAREQFEETIKQARKSGNTRLLAASLINLGNVKSALEDYDSARNDYLGSANIAEQASYHALAVRAYANAARVELLQGNKKSAGDLLQSAEQHIHSLTATPEKVELQLGLGRLFLEQQGEKSNPETAYRLLDNAAKTAEQLALKDLQAYAYGYLGALYLDNDRPQEALVLTNRAEFLAQSIDRPDILFRWQWQNGRILARQGAKAAALAAYRRAVATLQPMRGAQRAQRVTLGATHNVDDLFIEWADLLLKEGDLTELNLIEIRDIVEQGRVAELEDYYHDDCIATWLNKATKIDRLADRTAALYPILFPDRLELLLSLPKGLQRYTVRQNREEVRKLVDQLRVTLENRATPEFLPYAQALYQLLIKPVLADLTRHRIDTLVFVPDASFRTIPLAALHDGKDFLIKRFAVATSPGLTLTDPKPIQPENTRALLAGLSESSQGFQALPNVRDEIRRVAGQFPATILEDQSFRADSLRQQLMETPYRIVHIASHGQFSKNVANTFVLTSDGKISLDALGDMMGVSRFRNEPVELLTLSACQTAAGDDQAALGLAGVAVKAGARSALASLWFINDPASADLIAEFYRQLKKPGTSKAKALQQAQWLLLNDERYEHPAYWAPFLMIGNWL